MSRLIVRLIVALFAFLLGLSAAQLPPFIHSLGSETIPVSVEAPPVPRFELSMMKAESRNLSLEEAEVVAGAESFVCSNGYTDQPCASTGGVYFEPGESFHDVDQIFERRRDTLEDKAYGLTRQKRGGSTFWTVVFRYTERTGKDREKIGRAYTVEEDRFNTYFIRFRHDYPLAKVAKKL